MSFRRALVLAFATTSIFLYAALATATALADVTIATPSTPAVSDTVILAFVALAAGIFSPVALNILNTRSLRLSKAQDAEIAKAVQDENFARQDAVAERAAKLAEAQGIAAEKAQAAASAAQRAAEQATAATKAAAEQAAEAATLLVASNERQEEAALSAAHAADEQGKKLDQIHTLVNSNLTAAMQSELNALKALAIRQAKDVDPDQDMLDAMAEGRRRILELTAQLKDRLEVTAQAASVLASDAPARAASDTHQDVVTASPVTGKE